VPSPRIAIIGAGLAGIAAARTLRASGLQPFVFEKSRGLGGRCATKRWDDCRIDHGAQYFTLRDPSFRDLVISACGPSLLKITAPITTPAGTPITGDDRFYHAEGNSRLVRCIASDLPVQLETPVLSLVRSGNTWHLNGTPFDHILSSAPLPQTLSLLGLPLPSDPFIPCLTLILRYPIELPGLTASRYAISDPDAPSLAWSACENHKTGRIPTGSTVLVAHASESFSRQHLETPADIWSSLLRSEVESLWQLDPSTPSTQLTHRWRYARVAHPIAPPDLPPGIHVASDALIASRVESAFLAGEQSARNLLQRINL
jgi:renalase